MSLPLLNRVNAAGVALMPSRLPGRGEQYRFHFDMGRCIGCKCCVVACNEQHANPAAINWRRVGEIESGAFPDMRRAYLSMGCNHCVDPTCLRGCPVDAYTKDGVTGIVRHSADACIGCQYCTWTCSYGVPQYDAGRGVVGKCDMCHARLEHGQTPACVSACPEGAIAIELVSIDRWSAAMRSGAAAGLPSDDESISTTLVSMPRRLPRRAVAVDREAGTPQPAHASLIAMTVLTQLSLGAFAVVWALHVSGADALVRAVAAAALAAAAAALAVAPLHLGRPARAYRAVKGWKHSWLSREVLAFTAFTCAGVLFTAALWSAAGTAAWLGGATVALGTAGVIASARIYRVASRPTWNSSATLAQFMLTAAVLGPLCGAAVGAYRSHWLACASATGALAQIAVAAHHHRALSAARDAASAAAVRLLSGTLRPYAIARGALLASSAALPLIEGGTAACSIALTVALAAEAIDRYLFFATAVPLHMATAYLPERREAA